MAREAGVADEEGFFVVVGAEAQLPSGVLRSLSEYGPLPTHLSDQPVEF